MQDFSDLPGASAIERGLSDARQGRETVEALLIAIAAPRLAWLGVDVPASSNGVEDAELRLYAKLQEQGEPDPYSRYNALLRSLVSFERALEHRVTRARAEATCERLP